MMNLFIRQNDVQNFLGGDTMLPHNLKIYYPNSQIYTDVKSMYVPLSVNQCINSYTMSNYKQIIYFPYDRATFSLY